MQTAAVEAPHMSPAITPNDRPFVLVVALDLADTESGGYALDDEPSVATTLPPPTSIAGR
jgi:hypothetical protein